jgi:hypothetical protein
MRVVQSPGAITTKSGDSPPARAVVLTMNLMKPDRVLIAPTEVFRVDFQKVFPAVVRLIPP